MNERDRLRREIARRRKAVTDKILRTRKQGINVAGTEHDPRIDFSKVKNMGNKQLKDYLSNLTEFTHKDTTFIKGGNGAILSGKAWSEYEELQERYNQIGAEHLNKIADIKLAGDDKTIGDRDKDVIAKRAHGDIFHRPFGTINYKPLNIANNEALKDLTDDLRRKMGKAYLPGVIQKQRATLKELLITIGNPSWHDENGNAVNGVNLADELTDHQFYVFYNYGGGASKVFMHYSMIKMLNNQQAATYEDTVKDDLAGLFQWATRLPRTNRKAKK